MWQMCTNSNQAMAAFILETDFVGEYSQDGSDWKELTKDTKLSSYDGDLLLKGKFAETMPMYYSFYLNHIGMTISVNGEQVFESGRSSDEVPEMMCARVWVDWQMENLQESDEIEIRLHNPHKYGNAGAYREFLDSICMGAGDALKEHCRAQSLPWQIIGMVLIVIAVALLGTAWSYKQQGLPAGKLLWSLAGMTLFMGIYIWIDTKDIMYRSGRFVFNTCVRQYCIMFAGLALCSSIRKSLTKSRKTVAGYIEVMLGVVEGILLILPMTHIIELYDTGLYWAIAQGEVLLGLFFLILSEWKQESEADRGLLGAYIALSFAMLLELVNARAEFWLSGIIVKCVFVVLFIWQLIRAVRYVTVNQRYSIKARELEEELRNSRIILSMSQIRTHFIFNVLNAISGYCKSDAQKADRELIRFSRYLRNNINIMEEDKPIWFSKELEHLQDYVDLERLRFGEKLEFVTDIQEKDFKLPPLTLQPIVENAIKHGIMQKEEGGTISIRTVKHGKQVVISITDDGVGFLPGEEEKEGSVGMKNVRFRVEHMMHGTMQILSNPGEGTKVMIKLPISK